LVIVVSSLSVRSSSTCWCRSSQMGSLVRAATAVTSRAPCRLALPPPGSGLGTTSSSATPRTARGSGH